MPAPSEPTCTLTEVLSLNAGTRRHLWSLFCPCIDHPWYSHKLRVSQLLLPQVLQAPYHLVAFQVPPFCLKDNQLSTALTCKGLVKKNQILCQKHEEQADSLWNTEGKLPWYFHQNTKPPLSEKFYVTCDTWTERYFSFRRKKCCSLSYSFQMVLFNKSILRCCVCFVTELQICVLTKGEHCRKEKSVKLAHTELVQWFSCIW